MKHVQITFDRGPNHVICGKPLPEVDQNLFQFTWFSTNNTKIIKKCKNKGPTKYNWHEH